MHYFTITATHCVAWSERGFVVDSSGEATIEHSAWIAPRMWFEPTIEPERETTGDKVGSES